MLEMTYQVLAKKRQEVTEQVNDLLDAEVLKNYEKGWNEVEIKPAEICIGGVDGSINHKRYKNIIIYAVNAVGLVYDKKMRRTGHADVGVLHPYYQVEERLHLYRAIYELKTALEVIDEVGLFLIDGSLLSDLKALRTLERGLSKEAKEEVLSLLPDIERSSGVKLASTALRGELGRDNYREKVGFLEYLEYLSSLEKLIARGMEKIVGISKLSTRSTLGKGVPDIAIYEEVTKKAGHSPLEQDVVSKRFPVYDELFRSLVFTITHIRLEDKKGVFMLEVPMEVDEGEIALIMERIRSVSVDGYPYLLKKAHNEAVIKNRDMERIVIALGIVSRTGREMLK